MSLSLVLREDLAHAVRSRLVWGLIGAFLLVMGVFGVGLGAGGEGDADTFVVFFAGFGGELVVPIAALVVGYMAVTGDRQSGRVRLVHGLGHSRRNVILGKAISRGTIVILATLAAFAAGGLLIVSVFENLPVATYVGFTLVTTLHGLAFAGTALGISAAAASRGRAMAGAIGAYLAFVMWEPIAAGLHYVVEGALPGIDVPAWYLGIAGLSPVTAYSRLVDGIVGHHVSGLVGWHGIVENIPEDVPPTSEALMVSNRVTGELPVYLTEWASVAVLLAWAVIPVAIGLVIYERADL